jgi:arylsulfatase A-like enzyme
VRGIGFVRGTNSALAKVPAGETRELMHTTDWLPTLVNLAGGSVAGKTRPLDGFDIWGVLTKGAKAARTIIAHNVPSQGYAGAFRMNRLKLLLLGNSSSSIHGMQTTAGAVQLPPPGFKANPHDVVPTPFAWTPPGSSADPEDPEAAGVVQLWLHDVVADPTESINLAASRPQLLQQMIAAFEEYQKGAVPDLADVRGCGAGGAVGCDPAANPALRADKAWGPFTDSKRCEWL